MLTANDTSNVKSRLIPELRSESRLQGEDSLCSAAFCRASLRLDSRGRLSPRESCYSPPTVSPSIRIVGEATLPRNSRSFAISEMLQKMSLRLPATVISSTG
jgi:hypothetical protein